MNKIEKTVVGKYIVDFEQDGNFGAKYGEQLLVHLSKDLTVALGKGLSKSNLRKN